MLWQILFPTRCHIYSYMSSFVYSIKIMFHYVSISKFFYHGFRKKVHTHRHTHSGSLKNVSVSMCVHSKLVHPIYFLKINDFYTFNCSLVLKLINFFNYNSLRRENIFAKLQKYDNLAHRSEFCCFKSISTFILYCISLIE